MIIWAALTLRYLAVGAEQSRDFNRVTIMTFVSAGVLFALHFYPLAVPLQHYLYLGMSVLAVLSLAVFTYLYFGSSSDEEDDSEVEEDGGVMVDVLGAALMFGPVLVCLLLAGLHMPDVLRASGLIG